MNIQQLFVALQPFQATAVGTLTIPAADVTAWTGVHDLIVAALSNQTLAITNIAAFPPAPSANAIRYQGQATLFPWSGSETQTVLAVTATFSVDASGEPQLLVRADVPASAADWVLGDSLHGLDATDLAIVAFEQGFFLVTSQAVAPSDYYGTAQPFIAFQGVLSATGPFAVGQVLLPTPQSRTVAGAIDLTQGAMPVVTLGPAGGAPNSLAGIQFEFGASLSAYYETLPYYDPDEPLQTTILAPFSSAQIVATLAFGVGPALALTLPVLPASDFYSLSVAQALKPLSSWSDLDSLSSGIDLGALIPADVPTAISLFLHRLELSLYFPDTASLPTVNAITFDVVMNVGDWPLLPNNILTVQDVGALMTVAFADGMAPYATGSLYTDFTIVEEVPMVAGLSIPRLLLTATLQPGITVSVESLMASVMEKLTGRRYAPPIEMDISRLEMSVEVQNRTFGFGADILTDWSIAFGSANGGTLITLGFDGISFDIEYNGQLLQGSLSAYASINEGEFYFTAISPGDGAGWGFAGGLMQGSTLSVTHLLLNFMYPDGEIPGGAYGVPDLVIDKLGTTLVTDATNSPYAYTFDGGMSLAWTFSVFPGSPEFRLSASVHLEGTREPPERVLPFRLAAPSLLARRALPVAPPVAPLLAVDDDAPWSISGNVQGTFSLYGLDISAGYQFSPENSALNFGIWYKNRGIQATLTQQAKPGTQEKEAVLSVRLGDLSFGEILEYLIGLALPGETRRLSSPWDVLYQINFKNLSLVANLATNDVEVNYLLDLDFTFARFDSIGLLYRSVNGEGRVYVQLTGEFLGQSFGGDDGEPLAWDVINEAAPEVPGKGPTLVDLRYVGLGQHIALSVPVSELDTVEKVITALKASMKPVAGNGNPLADPAAAALRYDGNSNWMFGLDATILDTVTLSAVFFDPVIYGGLIALSGPRAGPLAGLRFELLYRKITDDIGELSVDLRIPDMFRHLEFGEVSITLGTIHVDIYTNGNFRVDLGFPHNQDFSRAFAVEVFPFVGEGGFYFAYLTGATSDRVPLITNGEFSPVIEAGVGLAVGLGKDFQAGPLKAGLKVEVYGIFEGVFAPFNPYDRAIAPDNYFWLQGTAGIVGTLYGSVDFVVIRAEVSIVARASITFVLEAHQASDIELRLEVTAKAKIKILFVTIHFSFGLTIEESFVIGSPSATPWIVGTRSDRLAPQAYLGETVRGLRGAAGTVPRLRQQRSQRPALRLTRLRHARKHLKSLTENPEYRSLQWGRSAVARKLRPHLAALAEVPAKWNPVAVFGAGHAKTARLQFVPMFTVADPASLYAGSDAARSGDAADPSGNQLEIVLGFIAENTIDPEVRGPEAVKRVARDHVHHLDAEGNTALSAMVEAFFRWAAQEGAGKTGSENLTLLAIDDLLAELGNTGFQQATFEYGNLSAFLADSLNFEVVAYPGGPMPSDTSGTFVPVMPEISAQVLRGATTITRDYAAYNPVSANYAANLPTYFQQLLTSATGVVASPPAVSGEPQPAVPGSVGAASVAELIFSEYFVVVTQAALQGAKALLQNYPYAYPAADGPSLSALAGSFTSLTARMTLARGQRLVDLALMTGHHPEALAAANPVAARGDSVAVDIPVGVTALSIAEDNPTAELAENLGVPMPALPYQVRSAQSLDDIAGAIPFVDPATPLTGIAIGTASARIEGLLRVGAALQVPAFTYAPMAGDTRNFLTAFFQVRNDGVFGVEYLDWYEQAISTMNPLVDWNAITTASDPIAVPAGYLVSTPAAQAYPIHQADTLSRIAASFALFQAMDNTSNPAVTAPVTIPAMGHKIGSTDTFASLAKDFPGLQLSALLASNAAADVLAPLCVLLLPPFTGKIPAGQSLQSLAAAYDLGMPDLVDIVDGIGGLFVGDTLLNIRDVPARTVDEFVAQLNSAGQMNSIASQVSNFLAHGVRAPAPGDTTFTGMTPQQVLDGDFTGSLYGIADLVGQQFAWPDPTVPVSLTLTHSSASWISFVASATVPDEGLALTPRLHALNPRLAAEGSPRSGLILATDDDIAEITLTIDTATFGGSLPSTTVTLDASAPAAMENFEETPVEYSFQVTQHWQAASQPELPGSASAASPGEPSLWPLPSNLQQLADAGGNLPFGLSTVALTAAPGTPGAPIHSYAWAIRVPVVLNRVSNPNDPGDTATVAGGSELGSPWMDGIYLVKGASAGDSERLYDLWTYLAQAVQDGTDSGKLHLLYPPNATSDAPKGYASDLLDESRTVLLKTNLSTVTRDPGLMLQARAEDEPPAATYSATIAESVNFLTLLWEASVVVEGGFYLRYDSAGSGLPDFVFDETGRGTIQVLCLLHSQTSGTTAGGPLRALNNVAVVTDNVDASAVQVYAAQVGAGAPQTRVATFAPGSVGFAMTRVDPAPPGGAAPTPAQLAGMLYGLVGYKIAAGTGFVASNEAVPQGPAPDDTIAGNVLYSQTLCVYPRATAAGHIAQNNPWLPAPTSDPYAGISATASVALSFAAHDVFGNKAIVEDPIQAVSVPDRYTDRLGGIGDWPGTSWSYTLAGAGVSAAIEIDGALQANIYLPDSQVSSETALRSASAHAFKFCEAFYQISRPGIAGTIETTFASAPLTVPLAPLTGYLSAAYVFTSQIAGLTIKTYTIAQNQTLEQVAGLHSLGTEDLLRDNLDRPVSSLFATAIVTPVFGQVKHNETLNAFATRFGLTTDSLLSQWGNAAAALVPDGTGLAITPTTGMLAPGETLRDYAARSLCTPADIAAANADATGLIADGVSLIVATVVITTSASTFTTLTADFANAGVTTNPQDIATRNQDIAGLFVAGDGDVKTYVVDRLLTAAMSNVATLVSTIFGGDLATFTTLNGDFPGLVAQDTRLQVASTTQAPPADGLRHYLNQQSGLTIADFAVANAASAMTQDSTILLPALLDPARLAAVPYGIQPNRTLDQIAALFDTDAETLGTQDQDISGIFVPGQSVTVADFGTVHTSAGDSIASLVAKFPSGNQPTLAQVIAAIAGQAGLLLEGAALICPVAVAGAAGTMPSIAAIADTFLAATDGLKLAKANAALAGFLKQDAHFTIGGHVFTVGPWQTLANTFGTVNAALDMPLEYDAFLAAILDQPIVDPASKVLLPPPGVVMRAALPSTPAMADTITQLAASLTLARPADEIDANFAGVPEVARATAVLPPKAHGVPATLAGFANAVAAAYGGEIWIASGASNLGDGNQRQYAVRFEAPAADPVGNAIREVRLGNAASLLGLPPLANYLVSRTADIRTYLPASDPPFSETGEAMMFQGVDVMDWAADFLATMDLVLSPSYASTGYLAAGSAAFTRIVAAKASLAEKISAQLAAIEQGDSALDLTAAQLALEQQLRANLSMGFDTDAVIQVPATVQASFSGTGADGGGHRLTGKVNVAGRSFSRTTTLQDVARGFTVSVAGVTKLLAATPNVLETGTVLALDGKDWTIADHQTLNDGMAALETTLETFAATFADQAPLFRDGVLLTIDGYSATVVLGSTLDTMADALDVSLRYLALANADLAGLLTGTIYINGTAVQVTPATSSLSGLAQAQSVPVTVLAVLISGQAVLTVGAVMNILRWVPEYSLTPGKIGLDASAGALTLLLNVKNRAHYRRLFLNLGFDVTALEYAIEDADYADGYQTSKWLHFVNPLPDTAAGLGGAVIETGIGQVDIPVPLRAYPPTPRLVNQRAQPTYTQAGIDASDPIAAEIAKAEAWSYYAGFEMQLAAQDSATVTVGFNYRQAPAPRSLAAAPDPFAALAEYAVNAAAIKADLVTLIKPESGGQDGVTPGQSAVLAMADLATRVAANWGFVQAAASDVPGDAGDGLVPGESYGFVLQTRTRSGEGGEPLLDALVLVRTADTAGWGPGGEIPSLGYIDADGHLRALEKPPQEIDPLDPPSSLTYVFKESVPDAGRRVYVIWYDDLNVVAHQNARASLLIARNQNLVPGKTTNPQFVYRTPTLTFTNLAVPNLRRDESLLVGTGTVAQLSTALASLFTDLLGAPPTAAPTQQKMTGSYGYRLAAAGPADGPLAPGDLVSLTPMFYRPTFAYDIEVPADTEAAVTAWFADYAPEPDNTAFLSFSVQIFSTMMPERQPPLIEFTRLDYQISS